MRVLLVGMLCALVVPASAYALHVRITTPVAGVPCRVVVSVDARVNATVQLQERVRQKWRTVATKRLKKRSVTLSCPSGIRRFRAIVKRGNKVLARSQVVTTRVVAPPPVPAPAAPPQPVVTVPANASPPAPTPEPKRRPIDPKQYGAEGTGGPPDAETLALLSNPNVVLDADGIADLQEGRIDPRVVAVLGAIAKSHKIVVSSMCRDHAKFTTGGSVSHHYVGRGVDIAQIDGIVVSPSNPTAYEVAAGLASLEPSYRPDEVGSPFAISSPGYFTSASYQDNIHIAFEQPIDPGWTPPVT